MTDAGLAIPAAVTDPQPLKPVPEVSRREAVEAIDAEMEAMEAAVSAAVEAALDTALDSALEDASTAAVEAKSTEIETSSIESVEAIAAETALKDVAENDSIETSTVETAPNAVAETSTVETATNALAETSAIETSVIETASKTEVETSSVETVSNAVETAPEAAVLDALREAVGSVSTTSETVSSNPTLEANLAAVVHQALNGTTDNPLLDVPFITHEEVLFKTDEPSAAELAQAADYDRITMAVDAQQLLNVANGQEVAASDGIEILVRLAQRGEIDPKNVDIIDVTDKFLKLIAAAPKENLRQSGKILFHACVLLRMKAEALLNFTAEDPVGDDFIDFEDEDGGGYDSNQPRQITLKDLERAIVRRSQKRQVRKRQVTLEELIEALREAERIEKSRADRKPPRAVIELAGQHDVDCVDDLLDLAHDEDVESTIVQVEILLARILKLGERIDLMRMVSLMDEHKDWVDGFLASLFLSNAGKIDLYQEEFYGPLFIGLGTSPVPDTVVT